MNIINITILIWGLSCIGINASSQQLNQQDDTDLFELARKTAFAGKHEEARKILDRILDQNPTNDDARIFKARTLGWDAQYDEARKELKSILDKSPSSKEAWSAITDIEIWDKNFRQALVYLSSGLGHYPNSEDLLYKKAWSESESRNLDEAFSSLDRLLILNPSHAKGKQLWSDLVRANLKNTIGVSYGLDVFDRTYGAAQNSSLQWARSGKWGTGTLKLNHANRFGLSGLQPELDWYPKLAKGSYLYLNYGYSGSALFPLHRIGVEVYSKIPKRFEVSAGARYLNFSSNKVILYTGSVGVYIKNYWFSLRSFIAPFDKGTAVSSNLTLRRYFENADNYVGVSGGAGYSSEDTRIQSSSGLSADGIYELRAQRLGVTWQKTFRHNFILTLNTGATRQELAFEQGGYVWITNLSVALRKRF